ncbi:MAG: fibronectin type III domain-containing protein [Verrucomicrobiales bacterium]
METYLKSNDFLSRLMVGGVSRWAAWVAAGLMMVGAAPADGALSPPVSILLSWDANTEAELDGYRVRHGEASGVYGEALDVGNVTEVVLPGMEAGTTYYFVVTAYNTLGEEGPPSDEISFTPTITPPSFVMEPLSSPAPGDPALSAPRASIGGWATVEDGGFRFVVTATPGQSLRIFASNDMLNWELLGVYDNPTGRFQAIDYAGGTSATRYYQVLPAGG